MTILFFSTDESLRASYFVYPQHVFLCLTCSFETPLFLFKLAEVSFSKQVYMLSYGPASQMNRHC